MLIVSMPPMVSEAYEFAYEMQFQHLTRDNGLSQGTGYAINQDSQGFMWFGTQEGLNRFDGRRMKSFKKSNEAHSLNDSYIYTIENDPLNPTTMWLGTHDGLHQYNHQTGKFVQLNGQPEAPISDGKVYTINFESSQFAWLGTGNGLNYFDLKNNKNISFYLSYPQIDRNKLNIIYSLVDFDSRHLLLATPAGLFLFDRHQRALSKRFALQGEPIVWKLQKAPDNSILIGSSNGLFRINKKGEVNSVSLLEQSNPFVDKNVYSLYHTRQNELWVGTGSGLFISNDNGANFKHLQKDPENNNSLVNNTVWSIFEDRSGIVWVGTDNGISRYNPKAADFQILTKRKDGLGISDHWVSSIYKNTNGLLWVGTNNGIEGFDHQGKKIWHITAKQGLSSPWIYSALEQNSSTLWVGTYEGLNKVDLTTGDVSQPFDVNEPLRSEKIWCLLNGGDGYMWIGTSGGLFKYEFTTGVSRNFTAGKGSSHLTDNRIYALHKDNEGNLWVGTSKGLNRINLSNNHVTRFQIDETKPGALKSRWITGLSSDSQDRLWVSTDNGLYYLEKKSNTFIELDGFIQTSQHIYAIEIDNNDQIWISTNGGIGRIERKSKTTGALDKSQLELSFFTKADGLQDNEFNEFASLVDESNNVYFGGVNGLNVIAPDRIQNRIETPPSAVITDLAINGEIVKAKWESKDSPLSNRLDHSDGVKLDYFQNYLTFYFAALDYANPESNRLEYRLIGFNDKWSRTTDNQPFVNFQRLAPGNYQLQLRSATARSDWGEKVVSLNIQITPPFWLSTSAYFSYVFMLTIIIVWSYFQYKKRLQRLQKLVIREQQVATRLKEVDAIKDQFLANTSHELKTPLNAIIGLSEYLLSEDLKQVDATESKEVLELIKNSGTRMNELVEDILQCSTLSGGNLILNLVQFDLAELINECIKEVKISKDTAHLTFKSEVKTGEKIVEADRNRIKQVLLNLISNAVKFTHEGQIIVSARPVNQKLLITVSDTGIGIEEKYHESIFDAFVQVDGTLSRQYHGSGLGLSIVKQLVALHGGDVFIESSPEKGTAITFSLGKRPSYQ